MTKPLEPSYQHQPRYRTLADVLFSNKKGGVLMAPPGVFWERGKSERQFEGALHHAGGQSTANDTGGGSTDLRVGVIEICPIERIEQLPTEAHLDPLLYGKVAVDTSVHVEVTRSHQNAGS